MKKIFSLLQTVLRTLWRALSFTRSLVANLLFLLLLAIIMVSWSARETPTELPERAALLLQPVGTITEATPPTNPWEILLREKLEDLKQVYFQDLLDVIDKAARDPRIVLLVVAPDRIEGLGLSRALSLNRALRDFRKQGKEVIAVADGYTQNQYLAISSANEIILNPIGGVELQGLARYRLYGRQALEKLKVDFHLFRAGEYKSALEPFVRDDMSEAARAANQDLLADLWQNACSVLIASRRHLKQKQLSRFIDEYDQRFAKEQGDAAQTALAAGLVDRLLDRPQWHRYLATKAGPSPDDISDYARIDWQDYLEQIDRSYIKSPTSAKIALLVARGEILPGRQPDYRIGADDLVARLEKARRDDSVKAVVLRLDSGGGSLTASEIIRNELLALQETGKPVVVSMGSLAASGAYWIAADADEIWAEPTTLTGSIGVFGALPTVDRGLAELGLHSDGVATSSRAGSLNPARPLPPAEARIIQLGVNWGYRRFLEVVAKGRNLSAQQVAKIAQGRVWSGRQARKLGLVDHLGSLADAVIAAASRVGLTPDHTIYWQTEKKNNHWQEFLERGKIELLSRLFPAQSQVLPQFFESLQPFLKPQTLFVTGDPHHLYAFTPIVDFTRDP